MAAKTAPPNVQPGSRRPGVQLPSLAIFALTPFPRNNDMVTATVQIPNNVTITGYDAQLDALVGYNQDTKENVVLPLVRK